MRRDRADADADRRAGPPGISNQSPKHLPGFERLRASTSWTTMRAAVTKLDDVMQRWQACRKALPKGYRALSVGELSVPTRMFTYCDREGLATIGELFDVPERELRIARDIGVGSLDRTVDGALEFARRGGAPIETWERGLIRAFRERVSHLPPPLDGVLLRRSGLSGEAESSATIAERLGTTRQRVDQMTQEAVRKLRRSELWTGFVRGKFEQATREGAVPIRALVRNPWWKGMSKRLDFVRFIASNILDEDYFVVEFDGTSYLSAFTQAFVDDAWKTARAGAQQIELPAPVSRFRQLARASERSVGGTLAEAFGRRLGSELSIDADASPRRMVAALGHAGTATALRILSESRKPLHRDELLRRVGGKCVLPSSVLPLGSGKLGLARHVPDYARWSQMLAPSAVRVMKKDPKRQWHAHELHDALGAKHELPDWLDAHYLSALLRGAPEIRCVGRLRHCLPAAPSERIQYRPEIRRLLERRGSPMTEPELLKRLAKRFGLTESGIGQALGAPEFLRCGPKLWGLLARDLPGGERARAEAVERTIRVVRRSRGPHKLRELTADIQRHSKAHESWTPEMMRSVLRTDERLRVTEIPPALWTPNNAR